MRRLLIRPGAIGDFIVSLPALQCLKADYLEVWTPSAVAPLVRFADRVRSIASVGLDLLGITEPPPTLIPELRSFDSIISWYGANRPGFRQLASSLDLPMVFLPALPHAGADRHAVDFYLEQVRGLGYPAPETAIPHIPCEVAAGNYAVIHPFSGSPRKNWPLENFRALARGLERTMPVCWCRGPEDPPLEGAEQFGDLYQLACWLAAARLYVGNDSGVTHLAAAVGTPTLAIFGPTDPAVWAPRGPHVRVARASRHHVNER